jgi:hypothetical protein
MVPEGLNMGINCKAILLSLTAILAVGGMMGTAYACPFYGYGQQYCYQPDCGGGHHQKLDLLIRDQNEGWKDGVTATWVADNMAPGDEYTFGGAFVGLRSNIDGEIGITCDYSVREESPPVESDADPYTNLHPDSMARELIITQAFYKVGNLQIDLLGGGISGVSWRDRCRYLLYMSRWRIQDTDHDGRITFYDLKHDPPSGLPIEKTKCSEGARYQMSVKFAETAGNDLQGDALILSMFYTLGQ